MIDPVTALAGATAAFNTIKAGFSVGRDIESMAGDLGRWMNCVSDIKKAEEYNRKPPLFKKLFASGSVEEEALALLIHEKTIKEQEAELQTLLNWRSGFGTWKELIEMRRKIRQEREETIYRQQERKQALLDGILIVFLIALLASVLIGFIWLMKTQGII